MHIGAHDVAPVLLQRVVGDLRRPLGQPRLRVGGEEHPPLAPNLAALDGGHELVLGVLRLGVRPVEHPRLDIALVALELAIDLRAKLSLAALAARLAALHLVHGAFAANLYLGHGTIHLAFLFVGWYFFCEPRQSAKIKAGLLLLILLAHCRNSAGALPLHCRDSVLLRKGSLSFNRNILCFILHLWKVFCKIRNQRSISCAFTFAALQTYNRDSSSTDS